MENVLIVDGYSSARFYPKILKNLGCAPYHLMSGMEQEENYRTTFNLHLFDENEYEKNISGNYRPVEELAKELAPYHFSAVLPGCEGSVLFANALAKQMELPYNEGAITGVLRNKYDMQQALAKANLKHICSFKTADIEELLAWKKEQGLEKIVIKPLADSASNSVFICEDEDYIRKVFSDVLFSKDECGKVNQELICQEFIEGDEYVVNHVSKNGKHVLGDIERYSKVVSADGHPLYDSEELLDPLSPEYENIIAYVQKALDALSLTVGPSHAEVKLTKEGPVLIEVGARLVGGIPEDPQLFQFFAPFIELAAKAYLNPSKSLLEKPYTPIHLSDMTGLLKYLLAYEDKKLESVPAKEVLASLPTAKVVDVDKTMKLLRIVETRGLETTTGKVFLIGDKSDVMRDYQAICYLEKEKPHLLYKAPGDPQPTSGDLQLLEEMKRGEFVSS